MGRIVSKLTYCIGVYSGTHYQASLKQNVPDYCNVPRIPSSAPLNVATNAGLLNTLDCKE